MMFTDTIDNMRDALQNGQKQYGRHIKSLEEQMTTHYIKLHELNLKLQYLQNMKSDGTTKNKFNLLMQK